MGLFEIRGRRPPRAMWGVRPRSLKMLTLCVATVVIFILLAGYSIQMDGTLSADPGQLRLAHVERHVSKPQEKDSEPAPIDQIDAVAALPQATNVTDEQPKPLPIINPHSYKYIINDEYICKRFNYIFVLIFVPSSPNHLHERMRIRDTYGQYTEYAEHSIRTIFFLGKTDDAEIQQLIVEESEQWNDIVQEDFVDHYRNLTLKHIMALKWITTFCHNALHIVKADDDTLVNIFRLVDFLISSEKQYDFDWIYCSVFNSIGPRRDVLDKWYVSRDEYPDDKYPPYCEGFAYIMPPLIASQLYRMSVHTKLYWVDDVYVTGILRTAINAKLKRFRDPDGYKIMETALQNPADVNNTLFLLDKYSSEKHDALWEAAWDYMKDYSLN